MLTSMHTHTHTHTRAHTQHNTHTQHTSIMSCKLFSMAKQLLNEVFGFRYEPRLYIFSTHLLLSREHIKGLLKFGIEAS